MIDSDVKKGRHYSLGIALSGGGARGFAHVGALKAMEELGIRPDIVAGVSAGAIVAVMYAAGLSPDEIFRSFSTLKFTDICELGIPKDGFFKMDGLKSFLRKQIKMENIEDLPIPTVVCATDLGEGVFKVFSSGRLIDRVVASCSIPIVFKPVKIDGIDYVDGGVLHNLPSRAIRDACETLIGVNCSPMGGHHHKNKGSILDIASRSYMLMSRSNALPDMEMCDIVIQTTDIADYKVFNLREIQKVYDSGYKCAIETLKSVGFPYD